MKRRVTATILAVAFAFAGAACEPSDNRPNFPRKIAEKRIDPPRYKEEKKCAKRDSKDKCIKYKTVKKEIDDQDYVLVLQDGVNYNVSEKEYNSVKVGDYWPVD